MKNKIRLILAALICFVSLSETKAQNPNVFTNSANIVVFRVGTASAIITNVTASGGVVTYTGINQFVQGEQITITGVTPASYNLANVYVATATSTSFTVNNPATGTYVSGGVAAFVSSNNFGAPVSLVQYTNSGTAVDSLLVPSSGSNSLIISANATSEGCLNRSGDGYSLVIPGYNRTLGTNSATLSSTSDTIPRAGRCLSPTGYYGPSFKCTTSNGNYLALNNMRSANTIDGNQMWLCGPGGLIYLNSAGSATQVIPGSGAGSYNMRYCKIFNTTVSGSTQSRFYFSTAPTAGPRGIYRVNNVGGAIPTTSGATATLVVTTGGTASNSGSSPYGFAVNGAESIIYVADDGGNAAANKGIHKWTYNGSTWTEAYLFTNSTANGGARDLIVNFDVSPAIIYYTSGDGKKLNKIIDNGISSTVTTIATAAGNSVFRGLCLAPVNNCPTLSFAPGANPTITNVDCFGNSTGSATWTLYSGTTNGYSYGQSAVSYNWVNASGTSVGSSGSGFLGTSLTLSNVPANSKYLLTVSAPGCYIKDSVTITQPSAPLSQNVSHADINCLQGGNSGSITITGSGGTTPYQYSINNGSSFQSSNSFTSLPAGTYQVVTKDSHNCTTSSTSVTVVGAGTPSATATPVSGTICQNASTNVNITFSGGTSPYHYNITPSTGIAPSSGVHVTNPNFSISANPTSTTTYTLTVYDTCNNFSTTNFTINVNALPTIVTNPSSITVCDNAITNITASGGNTYTWSPNTSLSATTGASVNATPTSSITYTVTGTDNNGCQNTATSAFTVNPSPVVTVSSTSNNGCGSVTTTMTASGANSYSWSPAGGTLSGGGSQYTVTISSTTSYTVTGTSLGCSANANNVVVVSPLSSPPTTAAVVNYCLNSTATPLNATATIAGASLLWYTTPTGGTGSFTAPTPSTSSVGSTNYYVSQVPQSGVRLAITGAIDNGTPDMFTWTALSDIPSGTMIYFTDIGWSSSQNHFYNSTATNFLPAEGLVRFTATSNIYAGKTFLSYQTNAFGTWDSSGLIPGSATAHFTPPNISTSGDQLTAFSSTIITTNPLYNANVFYNCFDITNGFEDATSAATGNVPPSLSIAGGTANTFNVVGNNTHNFMKLNNDNTPRSASSWFLYMANLNNWTHFNGANSGLPQLPVSPDFQVYLSCESSRAQSTVNVLALPTPSITTNSPVCIGGTLALSTSTYNSYSWSGPNGFSSTLANPSISSVTTAANGLYTLTVTDGNNCSNTTNTTIALNNNLAPTATISGGGNVCAGNTCQTLLVSLTGQGPINFTYLANGSNPVTVGGLSGSSYTFNVCPTSTTTYTISNVANNTCSIAGTGTAVVNVNSTPVAGTAAVTPATTSGNAIVCAGNTVGLNITGYNGNIDWQTTTTPGNASSWISTGTNTANYTSAPLTQNTYFRSVITTPGCYNVVSNTVSAFISSQPVVNISNVTNNSMTINWSPNQTNGGSYNISVNGGTPFAASSPYNLTGLSSGTLYNITVSEITPGTCGTSSGTASATTGCSAPAQVTFGTIAIQTATINWTGAGNYNLNYRNTTAGNMAVTTIPVTGNSTVITGLINSTTYAVWLTNVCGTYSSIDGPVNYFSTPGNSCPIPSAPVCTPLCGKQILVSWPAVSGVADYKVSVLRTSTPTSIINVVVTGATSTIITTIPGASYEISVRSRCSSTVASAPSFPTIITAPPVFAAPDNVVISNPTCHSFTIAWSPVAGASHYDLEYQRIGGPVYHTQTTQTNMSLPNGASGTYNIRVAAIDYCTPGTLIQIGNFSNVIQGSTLICKEENYQTPSAININSEITIYPNPNEGEFNITYSNSNEGNVIYTITNLLGEVIYTESAYENSGIIHHEIKLNDNIAAGMYEITVSSASFKQTKNLIIVK